MDSTKLLDIARADYAAQEGYRDSLFQRLQFLLTASSLVIAANLSLMAGTPSGWKWGVLAVPAAIAWVLLFRLFRLVWRMHWGHSLKDVRTIKDYLDWYDSRAAELRDQGFTEAEQISSDETDRLLIEDYASAARHNREVNLQVQAIMTTANQTVLFLTLVVAVQAVLYVVLVTLGAK